MGLFVTSRWSLHYLPSTVSSSPLPNAAPEEGSSHCSQPWHPAGLGKAGGLVQGLRCTGKVKTARAWVTSASRAGAHRPSQVLSSGYSGYTTTQGQVPGFTEPGDKLLIVTGHLMFQMG